ncbi:glycosyltransferase family 4 protein [Sulfolobus acidocaldarius]|uniref:Gylcosyl transferase group 1 protein n=4 Tax=Sulfolobus acidocaldarius TaxID=2285 RepID=Q4J9D6_SULAC|nr:glycosyltransferase family 4 protein [Sulfolobus acidocaldarius]AAY80595.1 gylcosyl transferase group 1 protein [Sulfolobus acidocaldarius DSM 639]AGE71185.1 gylcosyl transferase group 1 protein [Sulfolobus acidocaldarius N8]AGE73455.1 gylcosyl transferase group 1 protein [Sulfolobus acidocaldarius Ron12/I]ALU28549.1 glycosyl transferase [Sulfolobus acidocaldarius]ALU31260.1 glycosyl transferase [Sulfolobus acidocaldarius]
MFSVSISTQTPPVRFRYTYRDLMDKYGFFELPIELSQLDSSDYYFSVGGVPKMMLSLINKFNKVRWVSLGPGYPPQVKYGDQRLFDFIDLDPENLKNYTRYKEGIYNESHGIEKYEIKPSEYISYADYNWISAKKLLEFHNDSDVYFINDFQLLLVGGIIGPSAPAILWYHIPFVPENLSPRIRDFIVRSFEGYDYVILSTKRDLEGLLRIGAKINARQVYPFIDTSTLRRGSKGEVDKVKSKYNIGKDEKVITVVARMDPMKSQDVAIMALKKIKESNAKLLLVGNGSFTSGALGTNKAGNWVRKLQSLASNLGVDKKVVFTGHVSDEELNAIYEASDVIVLPSRIEGFGLVVCEGWFFEKPAIVSSGAGVSELVIDGSNGFVFKSGNYEELAEKIDIVLKEPDKYSRLSRDTVNKCNVEYAFNQLKDIFAQAMKDYGKNVNL